MSYSTHPHHLRRHRQSKQRASVDSRLAHYETLKAQLTANARTSAEYDAAVREAARRAGV